MSDIGLMSKPPSQLGSESNVGLTDRFIIFNDGSDKPEKVTLTQLLALFDSGGLLAGANVTVDELNRLDDSAEIETIDSGDAISTAKFNTNIDNTTSGAGAVTLGVCPATMIGKIKTIRFEVDNGDVTLALTNVQGGSASTTATFADAGDELILIGSSGGKWTVVKEVGVTLA